MDSYLYGNSPTLQEILDLLDVVSSKNMYDTDTW